MTTLIALGANLLLFVIAAGALVSWLRAPRGDKLGYAVAGVLALVVASLLIVAVSAVWVDPRPFVVDHVTPLIAHSADNGFPSDHTAAAFAVATVVVLRDRVTGIVLLVLSALLGTCRVLAMVHHWPDIIAGALVGILAGVIATWLAVKVVGWLQPRLSGRHAVRSA